MRNALKSRVQWSSAWLWPLVVLVLPNCDVAFPLRAPPPVPAIPRTTAVFCDIERLDNEQPTPAVLPRHCASSVEQALGIRLAAAAVALNTGQSSNIGLDDSIDALNRCGGQPEAVFFQGPFPGGLTSCQSGIQIGPPTGTPPFPLFADTKAVCVAQCESFFAPGPGVHDLCVLHAQASTNLPDNPNPGFAGGCEFEGTLRTDFADPRRVPEAVVWDPASLIGVSASDNTLTRTAVTTSNLDAGAASTQVFTRGDGYVEFSAPAPNLTQVSGLAMFLGGHDTDPTLIDISFAISLNIDNRFYVIENGTIIPGPDVNTSFGTYVPGLRFRVSVRDNSDGTAGISYSRINGPCVAGKPCNETVFYTHVGGTVNYPLRVDASFREQGATLSDVRVVRIQ